MFKFHAVLEEKREHFEIWKVMIAFEVGDALIMTIFSRQE